MVAKEIIDDDKQNLGQRFSRNRVATRGRSRRYESN